MDAFLYIPTRKMMDPKVQRITIAHSGATIEVGGAVAFATADMFAKPVAAIFALSSERN